MAENILYSIVAENPRKRLGYLQIADEIENMIRNGQLSESDRLPSTEEFIEIFGVSRLTVQRSLSRLSDRGMVKRVPRRGTFITQGISSSTIGLISGRDPLLIPSPYYRLLVSSFHKLGKKFKVNFNNYFFMSESDRLRNFFNLEEDIKVAKLKCLVIISTTDQMNMWLEKHCNIPWIVINSIDMESFTYSGVKRLCGLGYKNIKVLSLFDDSDSYKEKRETERNGMMRAYNECGKPGKSPELIVCGQLETDGYNYIKNAFSGSGDKPDAILINHDILTHGVLMALLEMRIRIPEDIGLITHENRGADILSPVKLDKLIIDPIDVVENTLGFVQHNLGNLHNGSNLSNQKITISLEEGFSTENKNNQR